MRWKHLIAITVIITILFSLGVFGESDITLTPTKNHINMGEKASYKLEITNNAEEQQRYSIYSLQTGQGWNVDPYPLKDKIISIDAGKSYTTTIIAQPLDDFTPGIYYVHLNIESDLGESYGESLKIYLSPEKPMDYLPSIKATIDMDEKINPQEPLSIKLFLENKNPLDLSNLKVKLQSNIPEFVKESSVELEPLGKKTIEFTIIPNKFQQPKDYVLFFVFENEGQVAKIIEQKIEIISLLPPFEKELTEETKLFKHYKSLVIKNEGNVLNTQEVKLDVSFWQSLFTTSDGEVKSDENGRYISWEKTLSPDESTTIYAVTNYRIIFYLIIILIIFAGFYLYVQSPLSIRKTAVTTKSDNEGALSEIKITLEIKNKTKKVLKNIEIKDIVPGIANVEKSLELGTLKPKSVQHSKKGTNVTWGLAELDAFEHRLITYKIKAKLNILGTFSLPRAIVEFTKKSGKKSKSFSNIFRLST